MNNKKLWKAQEKNPPCKNVRWFICEMAKVNGYVIKPIISIKLFYNYLQENHKSKMNAEQARNMAEVFSILCHVFRFSRFKGEKGNFSVSQKYWTELCIGRTALDNSVSLLKEMDLIDYKNYCDNGNPESRKRKYYINLRMLEILLKEAKFLKEQSTSDYDEDDDLDYSDLGEYNSPKKKVMQTLYSKNPFKEIDLEEEVDYG